MAALNLTPDFTVMASQAVLFSVNLYVVSKLWVRPYLEFRGKQKAFTLDAQTKAEAALKGYQAELAVLQTKIQEERASLYRRMDAEKQKALHTEKEQTEKSRQEAVAQVERFRIELRDHLEKEKVKVPQFVSELSQRCMTAVLHG